MSGDYGKTGGSGGVVVFALIIGGIALALLCMVANR